uniref:Uncharacterized protein n=1 Tax=Anguilla anguilla TaxID=7936 RepID=A0A0E9R334_ANGAN
MKRFCVQVLLSSYKMHLPVCYPDFSVSL